VDVFFCYSCRELHYLKQNRRRKKTAEKRFARTSSSLCKARKSTDKYQEEGCQSRNEHFTYKHLQVALKLSRHLLYSEANMYLKSASITQPKADSISVLRSSSGFELIDALLIDGRICARGQSWIFSPKAGNQALPTRIHDTKICEHIDSWVYVNDALSDLLRCKFLNMCAGERSCVYCSDLIRCRACFTDVHLDVRTVDSSPEIQAVVTTKWQYLEDGMSSINVQRRRPYHFRQSRQNFNVDFGIQKHWVEPTSESAVPGTSGTLSSSWLGRPSEGIQGPMSRAWQIGCIPSAAVLADEVDHTVEQSKRLTGSARLPT